jgi:hypothetical protein
MKSEDENNLKIINDETFRQSNNNKEITKK